MNSNNFVTRWMAGLAAAIRQCTQRFPAAVAFTVALTAWCIYLNHSDDADYGRLTAALTYYFSVGVPVSLLLKLWSEEMSGRTRRIATHATGQLLLLADAVFLYVTNDMSLSIGIAHVAAVTAIVVAVFVVPFFKERNDVPCWNFAARCVIAYLKAAATGLLLVMGVCLLLLSLQVLFSIDIQFETYFDIYIIFCVGLTNLFFIGLIPGGNAKHDTLPRSNDFLNIVIRYVFIPLTVAYMVVLYVYAGRILATWQLPNGWVSWLVTALMACCVIVEAGLYPLRQFPVKNKTYELLARWLPLLILPLLALMTIGIVRRIDDYGITVMRLYLAAFNLWCYGVCIALLLTRARRISWIPASFAAVFLIVSVIPRYNFTGITLHALRGEVETVMKQTCTDTPPLSDEQYDNWINNTLPEEEGQRINDKLMYISETYDSDDYSDLVAGSIYFYSYKTYDYDVSVDTLGYYSYYATLYDGIDIPTEARRITEVRLHGYGDSSMSFHVDEQLPVALNGKDTIYIDYPTMRKLNDDNSGTPYTELRQNREGFKFVLTGLTGEVGSNDSIIISEINGYLFEK